MIPIVDCVRIGDGSMANALKFVKNQASIDAEVVAQEKDSQTSSR